jgi:hypothetical protein
MDTAKIIELSISAFTTLLASFSGAWFAFLFTKKKAEADEHNDQAAAANRALFVLMRQFNALENIRRQLVLIEDKPDRHLVLKPSPSLDYSQWRVDFSSLPFLFDTSKNTELLFNLMLEDEQFHAAVQSVNERSQLHLASVQPLLERAGLTANNYYLLDHLESALGSRLTDMIRLATDEVYLHVGKLCESSPQVVAAASKSFKEIFPKHKFLYFDSRLQDCSQQRRAVNDAPSRF